MGDSAYFVGASKKDLDNHKAQIIGKFNNFKKGIDKVEVSISNTGTEKLHILLNSVIVYTTSLPGAITDCKQKVSSERGNKGKVVIQLKKARPGTWLERWSPSKEHPSPSLGSLAGTDSISSDSHISLPKICESLESSNKDVNSIP